jgi:beta-alanine degradation protein BauB
MGTCPIENWPSAPARIAPKSQREFAAHPRDSRVGNELLSETDRGRVWAIGLKPGQRLGFHTYVLDYFWTSVTCGQSRSRFIDGRVSDTAY